MNLTLNIGELVALATALLYVGASLESLRRLTASSISQGKRLGEVESAVADMVAVAKERERVRVHTAAQGIVSGGVE